MARKKIDRTTTPPRLVKTLEIDVAAIDPDRFWAKVCRDDGQGPGGECWEWRGEGKGDGYGKFRTPGGPRGAHRVAHSLAIGPIPDGMVVMHLCDNPPCCNPAHLRADYFIANVADRDAKGRQNFPYGERMPKHRLTTAQVVRMREDYAARVLSSADLSRKYGVSQPMVSMIVRGKAWRAAGGPISPNRDPYDRLRETKIPAAVRITFDLEDAIAVEAAA